MICSHCREEAQPWLRPLHLVTQKSWSCSLGRAFMSRMR